MRATTLAMVVVSCCGLLLMTEVAPAQTLGDLPPGGFRSPENDPRFAPESGVKPLNNLVFELLNVPSPGAKAHEFRNPREGWLYIRVTTNPSVPNSMVRLNQQPIRLKNVAGQPEAMHYAKEGKQTIALPEDLASATRLEVRAVGELVYSSYGLNPHIEETGVYTWDYLRRHALENYNSIIGSSTLKADGTSDQEAEVREWTAEGKRWFTREEVPYDAETGQVAYDRWAKSAGMSHPLMSGVFADEFGIGEKYGKKTATMYPIWIEGIRKLHADPRFANRKFYAYGPSRLLPTESYEQMRPFLGALKECGYFTSPEWYIPEGQSRPGRIIRETGDLISEFSPGWEQSSRESFELLRRGAATDRVVTVSVCSEPGWESCDLYPGYNYNAFLDAQMQFIATDPAFFGIRGLQSYHSGYCGEEQTRLFAKLVRHYAIEGNTKRFLSDPYVLPHLKNGDFTDATAGWSLQPGSLDEPTITVKKVPGLGTLQGRYHALPETGDTALWTRHTDKPNVISQQLRDLKRGRLYSLRMLTSDFRELQGNQSVRRKHAVSKSIEGAELVDSNSFQAEVAAGFWYPHGAFNARNPYWLNYHQVIFRATGSEATLRLSDWQSEQSAGGTAGEELLWNFIQVQPYFE